MDHQVAALGFSAMGSEARLHVLRLLVKAGDEGLPVGRLQQATKIPASTLAHHLKFLVDNGLIEQEKSGRSTLNRANFDHLEALASFILAECCSAEVGA